MAELNLSNAYANRALMEVINAIDADGTAATIKVYNETLPATPETGITTETLLAELVMSYPCVAEETVTTASWTGSVSTYSIAAHTIAVGARVKFEGFTPTGYNGEYTVTAIAAGTIDVAETSDPGAYSSGSSCVVADVSTFSFDSITDDSSANASGTIGWARVVDGGGTNVAMDVDAGVGSETLIFTAASTIINKAVSIDTFTISV